MIFHNSFFKKWVLIKCCMMMNAREINAVVLRNMHMVVLSSVLLLRSLIFFLLIFSIENYFMGTDWPFDAWCNSEGYGRIQTNHCLPQHFSPKILSIKAPKFVHKSIILWCHSAIHTMHFLSSCIKNPWWTNKWLFGLFHHHILFLHYFLSGVYLLLKFVNLYKVSLC